NREEASQKVVRPSTLVRVVSQGALGKGTFSGHRGRSPRKTGGGISMRCCHHLLLSPYLRPCTQAIALPFEQFQLPQVAIFASCRCTRQSRCALPGWPE